ncbi:MAG: alpha-ketoglutarate-dependent dioxygenase AlkB [Acidimicrobiia bacterium]|nr:alpha-ketoglutarate-dependent dioxygenase AlkB [Acidimicrobiia bacterium]
MTAELIDAGIASAQGKGTTDRCAPRPLSLFGQVPNESSDPIVNPNPHFVRHRLDPCCWVDRVDRLILGADALFDLVAARFVWEQGRRLMYGKWMDEPRLTTRLELDDGRVPPVVGEAIEVLEQYYQRRFSGLFCNFYRDGDDGVAWHADRIGQSKVDPLVAIISLGGPRMFVMRDRSLTGQRKTSTTWPLHTGDLLVMGGATQHHWEHSVPKHKRAPARISLTTRASSRLPVVD